MEKEDQDRLQRIEETIFLSIKKDVLEELGDEEWVGDSKQNQFADLKVATYLKQSFAEYKKNKPESSKAFFKF